MWMSGPMLLGSPKSLCMRSLTTWIGRARCVNVVLADVTRRLTPREAARYSYPPRRKTRRLSACRSETRGSGQRSCGTRKDSQTIEWIRIFRRGAFGDIETDDRDAEPRRPRSSRKVGLGSGTVCRASSAVEAARICQAATANLTGSLQIATGNRARVGPRTRRDGDSSRTGPGCPDRSPTSHSYRTRTRLGA